MLGGICRRGSRGVISSCLQNATCKARFLCVSRRTLLCSSTLQSTSRREDKITWSYKQGPSSHTLLGMTIGQLVEQAAEKYPERTAFVVPYQSRRCNFEQLLEQCDQLAAGLLDLGIKKGDRVGIWAPNCMEWVLAQYATARAGIILVNINPAYQVPELEYALRKVGVKGLILAEQFKTQRYYDMLRTICPELDNCKPGDLTSKKLPELKSVIMISENEHPGALKITDVMQAGSSQHRNWIRDNQNKFQFDDPINIQFTSGTTGSPKGATLTHHNIVNNARFIGYRMDYDKQPPIICMPVPLYHCFGMVIGSLQTMVHKATCVFPAPSFEPEPSLRAVQQERCTALYGTPTMFIDMLHLPNVADYDLTSLYTGVMAGSVCPVEIMKKVITTLHMPQVTICYGTTENSPVTFQSYMDDTLERRVSTIGQPHDLMEAKVIDSDGGIVPVGEKGELCTRGYAVMLNYWADPQRTAECIGEDRWYKTGDVAIMDEYGYAQIVGRMKDLIIRGGENIYPVEVEQLLYKHPKIADAQVIGVPDERLGEQVCVWVKLKDGETATAQEIKDFCKGQISHFKIPHYVEFVTEFPLTVTGKVQKYKMRETTVMTLGLNP